jgi:ribosomal-protein-alanine N-acetyltransferase
LLRRPFSVDEAREVGRWAYPPPFDLYDSDPRDHGLFLERAPDGEGYYPAVDNGGRVVAFVVLGAQARVHGQLPAAGTVDVGMGVRPDVTSQGLGGELFAQAADLARDLFAPTTLRAAVAGFNERSLALCRAAGFVPVRDFTGPDQRPFRELVRRL